MGESVNFTHHLGENDSFTQKLFVFHLLCIIRPTNHLPQPTTQFELHSFFTYSLPALIILGTHRIKRCETIPFRRPHNYYEPTYTSDTTVTCVNLNGLRHLLLPHVLILIHIFGSTLLPTFQGWLVKSFAFTPIFITAVLAKSTVRVNKLFLQKCALPNDYGPYVLAHINFYLSMRRELNIDFHGQGEF